jgi:hypothetical protein
LLLLAIATIIAGVTLRFALPGLPFWIREWGGSLLWAMMVYWLVAMLVPLRRVLATAGVAGTISTLVELVRLYHSPGLDAFRRTLAGVLLLGSVFSGWDIAAYWAAIAVAAAMDSALFRRGRA